MGSAATLERTVDIYESLRPEVREKLTYEQQEFVNSLDRFEAPYLQEKLLSDGKFETPKEYQEAFTEFKKYVTLRKLSDEKGLAMTSKQVDEVWHQFILFTTQYHEFCNGMLGEYLHHLPRTSFTPSSKDGKQRFVNNYQKIFGEIPNIWKSSNECEEGCWDTNCDTDCEQPSCDTR